MRHLRPDLLCFLASAYVAASPAFAQDAAPDTQPPKRTTTIIKMYDAEALREWADCAWTKLPVTSANLLSFMDRSAPIPENDGIPFAKGDEALHHRINALCGDNLPRGHRNAIGMVKSAKDRIFRSAAPENLGKKDQKVKAYICAHEINGRYAMTETDLEKPKPKRQLPGARADCFRINADGTLKDA